MLHPEASGAKDVFSAFKNFYLSLYLAYSDIRQKYRRSSIGPFWITISTAVMITCIGGIFGGLFKTPMKDFLPFLTSGLILWGFVSSCLIDSTTVFVSAESVIKQLPLPITTHVLRMVSRNVIIFFHNIIILPFVFLIVQKGVNKDIFLCLPGFFLLVVNLLWMSLLLGIICIRFRDLGQIVNSVLQIFFYITPIIWLPSLLPERTSLMILEPNLFYHLLQIVRAPLMGELPSYLSWIISVISAIIGWILTLALFNRYRSRIAYWL